MLDQQPSPPRPPDAPPSRHRPHPPKPKPAPKKLPQRGLGVAQLEKLRLEEEHSKQEAAWSHFHHRHLQQQQQQQQQRIQLITSHDAFPLLSDLLASSSSSLGPSKLPFLPQHDPIHDLWNPSPISPSNSSHSPLRDVSFQPRLAPPPNPAPRLLPALLQTQLGMQNEESQRHTDDLYPKPKDCSVAPSCEKGMQSVAGGLRAQNEGTHIPFTDLRLFHPHDAPLTSRNRVESPVVSIASTGIQARELSSFQTFPISSAWSSAEQVFSRKRPWVLNQEPARNLEPFKSVDLNTVADEIELESTEHNSPGTNLSGFSSTTSAVRDGWRYSSPPISEYISSTLTQDKTRMLSLNRPCTDCASVPGSFPAKMYIVSSALEPEYLSTSPSGAPRKGSLDSDASYKQETETCGEFLTLGPSTCLNRTHNSNLGTGSRSYGYSSSQTKKDQNSYESASFWQPYQSFSEQAKNVGQPTVPRVTNSDVLMTTAEDVQNEDNFIPLQINVELSTCWTEGHHSHMPKSASVEGSLDLELRLSL